MRVVTAVLNPEEIGRRDLVLSVTSWFALLLISPVGNYLNRHAVEWYRVGYLLKSLRAFVLFLASVAVLAAPLTLLLSVTGGIGTRIGMGWLLWLVAGSLVFGSLANQFNGILNIVGLRGSYVAFANLSSWLGLLFAVVLTSWRGRDAESWLSGILVAQLLVWVGTVLVLRRVGRPSAEVLRNAPPSSSFDVRSVLHFSFPLVISTCFYWVQTSGYRFLLAGLTDVETIGLLSVGLAVASAPLAMFDSLFSDYYRPFFYQDIAFSNEVGRADAWNRYASAYFPAILLVTVFLALTGPFLTRLLVSAGFRSVAWLALWGALLQGMIGIYSVYVLLTHASLNTRVLIRPNVIGAAVTLTGILLMAPWQPLLGPAIAMCLGMFVILMDTGRVLHARFPLHVPWSRMGRSMFLAIPLAASVSVLRWRFPNPTALQAIGVLGGGLVYLTIAQLLLARDWLFRRPTPPDQLMTPAADNP